MMFRNFVMTVSVGTACVACTSLDSTDLRTNGMQPQIVARSTNSDANTKLNVNIHVGDSLVDFVDIDAPDVLKASVNGAPAVELSESSLLGATGYTMDITGKEPGTEVVVSLERGPDDDGAPESKLTFTQPLALTSPEAGQAFSRATDAINVEWTTEASEDGVRVTVSGDCVNTETLEVQAGDTSITLEPGSIEKKEDPNPDDETVIADTCDIGISVVRTRTGTLDPAFGGGAIRHEFSASATVTSNP